METLLTDPDEQTRKVSNHSLLFCILIILMQLLHLIRHICNGSNSKCDPDFVLPQEAEATLDEFKQLSFYTPSNNNGGAAVDDGRC